MTTITNGTDTTKAYRTFSFSGSTNDSPAELVAECGHLVEFLACTLNTEAVELQGPAVLGLVLLLNGLGATLESAGRLAAERITEPRAAGFREGRALSAAEYRRGLCEGYAAGVEGKGIWLEKGDAHAEG